MTDRPFVKHLGLILGMLLMMGAAAPIQAAVYYNQFQHVTNNNATDGLIGERQLLVALSDNYLFDSYLIYEKEVQNAHGNGTHMETVSQIKHVAGASLDPNQVLFTFFNGSRYDASSTTPVPLDLAPQGFQPMSMTEVYFDDGTLVSLSEVLAPRYIAANDNIGVFYQQGAVPQELPGGNTLVPPFVTTIYYNAPFSADPESPTSKNGVDRQDEWLGILFTLQDGKTVVDVQRALQDWSLRIGVHVQAFTGDGSESFVAPPKPWSAGIPEPASLLIWSLFGGAAGIAAMRRRRKA